MRNNVYWFEDERQWKIATPPGQTIKELLNDKSMRWSHAEFAAKMEMPRVQAELLLNGELELTEEIARKLQKVLKVPAKFWIAYEKTYREKLKEMHNR